MRVADIQRFCMHDGDGLRTTVFLKGCPLRCAWCHNPETQEAGKELLFYEKKCIGCGSCQTCAEGVFSGGIGKAERQRCTFCGECIKGCPTNALEISGEDMTAEEVLEAVKRDMAFYGDKGGITVSGGEPFFRAEETVKLLRLSKEAGINTAVETCGYFDGRVLTEAVKYCDEFLWDVKDTDSARHKKYTGAENERIIENLITADMLGARVRLRCIIVNGVNTSVEHYMRVAQLASNLKGCRGIELIPYHSYGGAKAMAQGRTNNGNDLWIPTAEQLKEARQIICDMGVKVY